MTDEAGPSKAGARSSAMPDPTPDPCAAQAKEVLADLCKPIRAGIWEGDAEATRHGLRIIEGALRATADAAKAADWNAALAKVADDFHAQYGRPRAQDINTTEVQGFLDSRPVHYPECRARAQQAREGGRDTMNEDPPKPIEPSSRAGAYGVLVVIHYADRLDPPMSVQVLDRHLSVEAAEELVGKIRGVTSSSPRPVAGVCAEIWLDSLIDELIVQIERRASESP